MRRGNAIYAPNFVPRQNDNDSLQVPELRALLLRRETVGVIYDLRIHDVRFRVRLRRMTTRAASSPNKAVPHYRQMWGMRGVKVCE